MSRGASDPGDPSPEDLRAIVAGDRALAERLAARLLPRVRNLVRYLIRGDRDVEDVVQEALVSLFRGLAGYRGEGAFRSWADRVVARATFGWLARRKALENHTLDSVEHCPSDVSQPDEYLERRRVAAALDGLPLEQRHALVLHHVLGMSISEIAEETKAPAETVRSRLRLGRHRLRDALSPPATQKVS